MTLLFKPTQKIVELEVQFLTSHYNCIASSVAINYSFSWRSNSKSFRAGLKRSAIIQHTVLSSGVPDNGTLALCRGIREASPGTIPHQLGGVLTHVYFSKVLAIRLILMFFLRFALALVLSSCGGA